MSEDNANTSNRRCGQIGDGEDDQLTLMDALDEVDRLQADAKAVLGGSDEYNCTYPQGYLKRQAVYACATCTPEGTAGLCLACSYACHEGHDLHELYTKRRFKCDCGNEKFKGNKCQIYKEKKDLNSGNRYNQNFCGLYCVCSRPYPDEEDPVEDEMIQCILCEDWFHGRHLKTEVPDSSDYHEMICAGCMCKYSFLWAYHVQCAVTSVVPADSTETEENISLMSPLLKTDRAAEESPEISNNIDSGKLEAKGLHASPNTCGEGNSSCQSPSAKDSKLEKKKRHSEDENGYQEGPSSKKAKRSEECRDDHADKDTATSDKEAEDCQCVLESLQQRVVDQPDCAAFWSEGWRSKLCRCHECLDMYQDRNIEFLIDDADTMQAYEAKGSETERDNAADEEASAAAFASMGRVQQIEVVQGVMDFKSELNEFLQGFAREGKVVKESDVREFFERMHQRRRDRMHLPQPNCR